MRPAEHLFPIPIARGQTPPLPFIHHNIIYIYLAAEPLLAVRLSFTAVRRRTLIHDENKTAVAISHQRAIRRARVLYLPLGLSRSNGGAVALAVVTGGRRPHTLTCLSIGRANNAHACLVYIITRCHQTRVFIYILLTYTI